MLKLRVVLSAIGSMAVVLTASLFVSANSGTQGYAADRLIDFGTIVELAGENSNRVKVSSQSEMQNMFGVVIDPQQLSLRVSDDSLENQTFVAVSGTYNVLVSDQAGDIAKGDYVTMSAVSGVSMKAGTDEPTVFGRAASNFDKNSPVLSEASLKDVDGKDTKNVRIGSVPVTIDIRANPNEKSTEVDAPEWLKRAGQAIAEKEVSPIRIYISLAITAASLIIAFVVIYAGVRNGVISIGRNPMSKRSIFRALLEVSLTSLLILVIGLFAVYLLLRL